MSDDELELCAECPTEFEPPVTGASCLMCGDYWCKKHRSSLKKCACCEDLYCPACMPGHLAGE